MGKPDQNRLIDEWVAEKNSHIGEIKIPPVGEYPPDPDCFYGTILNEIVTKDLIRHHADGMGDRNPLWRNEDYAKNTRWGGIIAAPTFTDSIIQPYAAIQDVKKTTSVFNSFAGLPNGATRQLFQVIRPGDKFRAIQWYLGMKEMKPTRPEPCRQFGETMRRALINQKDEVVAILDRHFDIVINHDLNVSPYWPKRRKRRLTDEERDAIQNGYDNDHKNRRGSVPLYWEDVKEGDEPKPLTVGPLTVYDIAACYTAVQGHAVAFDLEWERIKMDPDFHWLDPEVNAWTCGGICHFCDDKGHAEIFDGGAAVSFYFQIEWLLGRMLTNWMGDNGFLRKLDDRIPILPILGDVLVQKGKVTKKYMEDGQYLVDLDIHCENLDGLVMMPGTATVQLPSKVDFKANNFPQVTNKIQDKLAEKIGLLN